MTAALGWVLPVPVILFGQPAAPFKKIALRHNRVYTGFYLYNFLKSCRGTN